MRIYENFPANIAIYLPLMVFIVGLFIRFAGIGHIEYRKMYGLSFVSHDERIDGEIIM